MRSQIQKCTKIIVEASLEEETEQYTVCYIFIHLIILVLPILKEEKVLTVILWSILTFTFVLATKMLSNF